jgi:hypothetical protein
MPLTTASCRRSARKAADQGRFALAAAWYGIAIKRYPSPKGQLAQADLKQLEANRVSCLRMCQ